MVDVNVLICFKIFFWILVGVVGKVNVKSWMVVLIIFVVGGFGFWEIGLLVLMYSNEVLCFKVL